MTGLAAVYSERDTLAAEIVALECQLAGLDLAMSLLRNEPAKKPIKQAIIDLILEYRELGLSAKEVVEIASSRGRQLNRQSVAGLLSRMKREGVLTRRGSKYAPSPETPR